mmetsp:Transcript_3985/g.5726  ORF Transcript_3985/g.5726 Transcript_3985/m.5726 type:complete len:123 (-) Transcript_3985:313-681(-)
METEGEIVTHMDQALVRGQGADRVLVRGVAIVEVEVEVAAQTAILTALAQLEVRMALHRQEAPTGLVQMVTVDIAAALLVTVQAMATAATVGVNIKPCYLFEERLAFGIVSVPRGFLQLQLT